MRCPAHFQLKLCDLPKDSHFHSGTARVIRTYKLLSSTRLRLARTTPTANSDDSVRRLLSASPANAWTVACQLCWNEEAPLEHGSFQAFLPTSAPHACMHGIHCNPLHFAITSTPHVTASQFQSRVLLTALTCNPRRRRRGAVHVG